MSRAAERRVSSSWSDRSVAVVARLRAAGCVFAEEEAALLIAAARSAEELAGLVNRRVAGSPLEHLLGWARFRELRVPVRPGVFVPRRRSEQVVDQAVRLASPVAPGPTVVVDLCCGCGAVGRAVAEALSTPVRLHAVDIDPTSVECARRTVAAVGGRVYRGDLFAPLPTELHGRVDLVTVVAPYVPTEAIAFMPPEAREHEPRIALDGGADGLDVLRRVMAEAPSWLAPGGHLIAEIGADQASAAVAALAGAGLVASVARSAKATVVIGATPLPPAPTPAQN